MSRFDEEPDGDPHGECEAEIKSLKYQLTNYRIAHEQQAATIADLRAQLDASQCRVELLESDMKSGTYETLYAQQAARITRLEAANKEARELLDAVRRCGVKYGELQNDIEAFLAKQGATP